MKLVNHIMPPKKWSPGGFGLLAKGCLFLAFLLIGSILSACADESHFSGDLDGNQIEGEAVGRGISCMQFRADDGELISLEGVNPQAFETGARYKLVGDWARVSRCMQGRSLIVKEIQPIIGNK